MMTANNIHSPIPTTKSQTCPVAFRELLCVRPDVPVHEALETASTILASVRDQLTQFNADSEGVDAPEVWTSIYLLEICHSIVCSAGLGCRGQESPSVSASESPAERSFDDSATSKITPSSTTVLRRWEVCNKDEKDLLALTGFALFDAINEGRLIVSDRVDAEETKRTAKLVDACYLVQDVIASGNHEELGQAAQVVCLAAESEERAHG